MTEKVKKTKKQKLITAALIFVTVIFICAALLCMLPYLAESTGLIEAKTMILLYPMDKNGKLLTSEEVEQGMALRNKTAVIITESDFKAYPEIESLFLGINQSMNKSEVTLNNPLSAVSVKTRDRCNEIRYKYVNNCLYYNGQYYDAVMPYS
ncbi:MAG: hypothetical protein Q4Q53_04505 [Methanocorpusculum sp.]|nr:hypothetical protein [Methanocorpusculum sp.]MDO5844387.1 hypothetical protein [Methanocorpusculum sp.]